MKSAVIGLVVGFLVSGLCWVGVPPRPEAYAQRPQTPVSTGGGGVRSAAASDLLALSMELSDGRQQVVLVDVRTRALGVYHIDRGTGQISLKSVRNVQGDLLMDDFNGGNPAPQEIRSLLDSR